MTILNDDSKKLPLTNGERQELAENEQALVEFCQSFVKAGVALANIRDKRLHRETHGTFEAYAQEQWGFQRRHAYRLMDAAKAVQNVSQWDTKILPSSERTARPLTKLKDPEQQIQAWKNAVEATSGKPTAKAVEKAVKELKGFKQRKSRKQPTVEQPREVSDHTELADLQIDNYSTASDPQNESESEYTTASIGLYPANYTTAHSNENKNAHQSSQNPPMKETSSCKWILDALQRRIMQILLYDQEVGMKIERLAREHGRLPQTIVIWGVDALEVLPKREARITELELKLRASTEQVSELEQALAQKSALLTELDVTGIDTLKAELEEKLAAAEYYSLSASARIAELERELAKALETIDSLKEQHSNNATAQLSNNATAQPSNNSQSIPHSTNSAQSFNAVNLISLIDFFDKAAEKLEKPTIQIHLNGNTVVVSRNSNSYSGKYPGVLNLNTGDGLWHGRINRDGTLFKSRDWQEWMLPILEQFALNPGAIAHEHGKTTGDCCFCNHTLTDPKSIATGYGPTCAKHYELQWPLATQQSENSPPEIELQTSEIQSDSQQPSIPYQQYIITFKQGDLVKIIDSRHSSELVGKLGTILDITDLGWIVEVEGEKFFFDVNEIALSPAELPF